MSDQTEPEDEATTTEPQPDGLSLPTEPPVPPPPAPPKATEEPTSARKIPRTWPQRLTIAAVFVMAIGSFGAAGALYAGQRVVEDRNIAPEIVDPSETTTIAGAQTPTDSVADSVAESVAPPETFPPVEPGAKNFLITGADNNSCIDPDSPYAPAFGDRTNLGERSDTIMMWRVNPSTSQVAVLSFPRDLFVDIAGTSRKGRINEAYERDNPQKLIDTIYQNFGINTDHFVQVDFCAFRTLVDAVGGVAVRTMVDLGLDDVDAEGRCGPDRLRPLRRREQGLRRNAAIVETVAAHPPLFDQHHGHAELCRRGRDRQAP